MECERHRCSTFPWIIACFHEAEGQWLLAISKETNGYLLIACPGKGVGREAVFTTLEEVMVEFYQRQEAFFEGIKARVETERE